MRRTITLICILSLIFAGLAQSVGCAGPSSANTEINASEIESKEPEAVEGNKEENDVLVYKESEELKYAKEFAIDYYEGGYTVLNSMQDDRKYLLVPEGKDVPGGSEDFIVIKRPVDDIYLVASAAMDMVVNLDALDSVKFSGQKEDNWYITEAREAMEKGDIVYAGKYNKPDYETIYMEGCKLAIENTMIYHSPEVLEQFDKFEIPYIVDYSSYENHPLARVEWIKFYGALLGCEEKAKEIFNEQEELIKKVEAKEKTGKSVVYFYVTSNNLVQVKKSSDYIPKMIEIAGGKYIFENLDDDSTKKTTVNMQVEEFYKGAKDADYIIYNSSIDGGIESIDDLINKCPFLEDFKAVKDGNVFCTTNDMYQQTLSTAYMIEDINTMLTGEENEMHYIYRVD